MIEVKSDLSKEELDKVLNEIDLTADLQKLVVYLSNDKNMDEAYYNPDTHMVEPEWAWGVEGVEFIYHGEHADPEILYKDNLYNYYDVEDYLLSDYKEEHPEDIAYDNFDDWVTEHANLLKGALDDLSPVEESKEESLKEDKTPTDMKSRLDAFVNKKENKSVKEGMASEVRNWWDKVESANSSNKWGFDIDNTAASDEDMLIAMFDMIKSLKGKDDDLFKKGKSIYNKYAKYSKYNESLKESNDIKYHNIKVGQKFEDKAGNIYVIKNISYDDCVSFDYRTKEGKVILSNSLYMDSFLDKMKFVGARLVENKVKDNESLKEDADEPKLDTFEEKIDFLVADEQEAIDGYDKILAMLGEEDANAKEQLEKIRVEEQAHKDFLEKVKTDKSAIYTEPLEQEEVKEKETTFVDDGKGGSIEVCPNCGKELEESVNLSIDEEALKEILSDRVHDWVERDSLDSDAEDLFNEMYDNLVDGGVFEGYKDFDANIIVDNDVVNYCKVVRKGSDFYDEVVNAYNDGESEIDGYYIEVARPEKDLYLIRYNG